MTDKILYDDVLSVQYLKKQIFTGSFKGMRYRIWSEDAEDKRVLKVVIWPEPLNYESSDPLTHLKKDFSYDEKGRVEAIDYLNDVWSKEYA